MKFAADMTKWLQRHDYSIAKSAGDFSDCLTESSHAAMSAERDVSNWDRTTAMPQRSSAPKRLIKRNEDFCTAQRKASGNMNV